MRRLGRNRFFGTPSLSCEGDIVNNSYVSATLQFSTLQELPKSDNLAFVVTAASGKQYLLGNKEAVSLGCLTLFLRASRARARQLAHTKSCMSPSLHLWSAFYSLLPCCCYFLILRHSNYLPCQNSTIYSSEGGWEVVNSPLILSKKLSTIKRAMMFSLSWTPWGRYRPEYFHSLTF